jgi:hypothetical protein
VRVSRYCVFSLLERPLILELTAAVINKLSRAVSGP